MIHHWCSVFVCPVKVVELFVEKFKKVFKLNRTVIESLCLYSKIITLAVNVEEQRYYQPLTLFYQANLFTNIEVSHRALSGKLEFRKKCLKKSSVTKTTAVPFSFKRKFRKWLRFPHISQMPRASYTIPGKPSYRLSTQSVPD